MGIQDAVQVTFGTSGKLKGQTGMNCNFMGDKGKLIHVKPKIPFCPTLLHLQYYLIIYLALLALLALLAPFVASLAAFLLLRLGSAFMEAFIFRFASMITLAEAIARWS